MATKTEDASALMLVPAGILVLLMLAAISVDSAIAFYARRELQNRAAAAANDAVTVSLTPAALQQGSDATPDPAIASAAVHSALDGRRLGAMVINAEDVVVNTDIANRVVTVYVEADVPYIFAPAIPGAKDTAHVVAEASAQLQFGTP